MWAAAGPPGVDRRGGDAGGHPVDLISLNGLPRSWINPDRRRPGCHNPGMYDDEVTPIMRVADADRAVAWYARLGFGKEWEHRFEPGFPAFVCVARGRARLFLSEHTGDARPGTLVYLRLADADAAAAELGVSLEDTPWDTREIEVRDPDGNRLRISAPHS
jgi:catechol 2,3-dioxygenase-like lactoylglutathione lyase family enzyme